MRSYAEASVLITDKSIYGEVGTRTPNIARTTFRLTCQLRWDQRGRYSVRGEFGADGVTRAALPLTLSVRRSFRGGVGRRSGEAGRALQGRCLL
jgi:hypothetical protein